MADTNVARFFLDPGLVAAATAGTHNFIGRIVSVLAEDGISAEFHGNDDAALRHARRKGGLGFVHMQPPPGPGILCFRRVYHYPFWGIEPSDQRWHWHVARTPFTPGSIDPDQAAGFARLWRKKLFGGPDPAPKGQGFLYVPLQGRLTEHRSFQSCAPVDMIRAVLAAGPRPVIATLHPHEVYTPRDHAALSALMAAHPRLTVQTGGMDTLLPACDAVITQNSSVAFNGYFLSKPAVLFAQVDFHHIALDATQDPIAAIQALASHRPEYDRYLFWFWQKMSINAGRPEAALAIRAALHRAGWPVRPAP